MLREVLRRLAGIVIVRSAVRIVMVARAFHVVKFMRDIEHFPKCKRAALHGKTLQGKHQHQENAEKAAHREFINRIDR